MADEPGFSLLGQKVGPHVATVWVDQAALNQDYYFKRYWLMKNDGQKLKNIRSGMFDLAIEDGKVVERREFLLEKPEQHSTISAAGRSDLLSHVPNDAALYRMSTAHRWTLDEAIKTIVGKPADPEPETKRSRDYTFSGWERDNDHSDEEYSNLGEEFDENIDDDDANTIAAAADKGNIDLSLSLTSARPAALISISEPAVLPKPLFARFNEGAVIRLGLASAFDRTVFESTIEKTLADRVMAAAGGKTFAWTTQNDNGIERRELTLPMLDIKVCYALRGSDLFLANDAEFLQAMIQARNSEPAIAAASGYSDVSVLNIKQTGPEYNQIFERLNEKNASDDFFTGSIASLAASVPDAAAIEVKRSYSGNLLHEETTMYLR